MTINLSKFHGIPTTHSTAKKQYSKIFIEESNNPFSRGRWLILKKETSGIYKGNYGIYIYETRPKRKFILKKRIPK